MSGKTFTFKEVDKIPFLPHIPSDHTVWKDWVKYGKPHKCPGAGPIQNGLSVYTMCQTELEVSPGKTQGRHEKVN